VIYVLTCRHWWSIFFVYWEIQCFVKDSSIHPLYREIIAFLNEILSHSSFAIETG